mmetsp:Transcript_19361/g.56583  ORF Transcript_19361/g.56583 Transcript_19361/m.56583 type:complete len:287 (+) Transcript_19361:2093-2953(+)
MLMRVWRSGGRLLMHLLAMDLRIGRPCLGTQGLLRRSPLPVVSGSESSAHGRICHRPRPSQMRRHVPARCPRPGLGRRCLSPRRLLLGLWSQRHLVLGLELLHEGHDLGSALPQALAGLLARLLVADVVPHHARVLAILPPARRLLLLTLVPITARSGQEPSWRIHCPPDLDDLPGDLGLLHLGRRQIGHLVLVYQFAETDVSSVIVGPSSPAAQDVIRAWFGYAGDGVGIAILHDDLARLRFGAGVIIVHGSRKGGIGSDRGGVVVVGWRRGSLRWRFASLRRHY